MSWPTAVWCMISEYAAPWWVATRTIVMVWAAAPTIHELLADLLDVGWSDREARGVCVELPPAEEENIRNFNVALTRDSGGRLAPWEDPQRLRYATLWGGHTNQVLRLFLYGMPHQGSAKSVCDQGMLSLAKLKAVDSKFGEAVEGGLRWRIISRQVLQRFPDLPKMMQAAGNCLGAVHRSESELQLCRKIVQACQDISKARGGDSLIGYDDIKNRVLRSKPRNAATVPFLFQFIRKFGGGESGQFLVQTERYVKACGDASRSLGPDFFDALSADCRGGTRVLFRHCVLKLAYTAPLKSVTVTDCKKATAAGMGATIKNAEAVLNSVKDLAKGAAIADDSKFLLILGNLECDLATVVLEKKRKDIPDHLQSIEHAGNHAVTQLNALGIHPPLSLPFTTSTASPSKPSTPSPSKPTGSPSSSKQQTGLLPCSVGAMLICIDIRHTQTHL